MPYLPILFWLILWNSIPSTICLPFCYQQWTKLKSEPLWVQCIYLINSICGGIVNWFFIYSKTVALSCFLDNCRLAFNRLDSQKSNSSNWALPKYGKGAFGKYILFCWAIRFSVNCIDWNCSEMWPKANLSRCFTIGWTLNGSIVCGCFWNNTLVSIHSNLFINEMEVRGWIIFEPIRIDFELILK